MSIHNSTTKHPITLTLGILAYLDPMRLSGLAAESDEVVFESSFAHREGSFSQTTILTMNDMSIHNSTTKPPITLTLGILAYLDSMRLSGLVAESDEVVFESSFSHREGSFSQTPPDMSIHNSTTKHPITLTLGILAYLDAMRLSLIHI